MVLTSIDYKPARNGVKASLQILDQLLLPHTLAYMPINNSKDAWEAIRAMNVRGAPAIALVAVLSLAIELQHMVDLNNEQIHNFIYERLTYLETSRPTAVNLADAVRKLKNQVNSRYDHECKRSHYIVEAEKMYAQDVIDNQAIGRHGAEHIMKDFNGAKASVLTICNTGSLATAGFGTAYSVINELHQAGVLERAYFCETRPYNQGARLTSVELLYDGIPSTMVLDSSIAALLSGAKKDQDGSNIKAILVGADRVALNGDTANKIGTHQLAILASHFGAQLLVCAPWTTIDCDTPSGEDIFVEERAQHEVRRVWGATYDAEGKIRTDAAGVVQRDFVEICSDKVDIWNPAFDVTPHELISGIVTETGVYTRDSSGSFQLLRRREEVLPEYDESRNRSPRREGPSPTNTIDQAR